MINLCKERSLPAPTFRCDKNSFSIKLHFKKSIGPTIIEQTDLPDDLTLRQIEIIQILRTNQKLMPVREILSLLSDPPASRTVGDDLSALKEHGQVEVIGIGRGAKWTLTRE